MKIITRNLVEAILIAVVTAGLGFAQRKRPCLPFPISV